MPRAAIVAAGFSALALAACGGSDYSSTLAQSIKTTGADQLSNAVANVDASATTTVDDASCVETGSSQAYTCIVHYNVSDPAAGVNQEYELNVDGSCDDSGACQWHATGPGTPQ